MKILKEEADIVCTNPPFSRMIDYWRITIESGKNFSIISNISNAINIAFIHYFKDNNVWADIKSQKQLVEAAGRWYTNISIKDKI